MNQYQWTFLDDKRRRHTLGIAHSAASGHLVVHCDHRVVLIEFSVLEPRTFTFFVDDELCKLSIEGNQDEGFTYNFAIDTEADTEVNRTRSKRQRRQRVNTYVSWAAMILCGVTFVWAIMSWGHESRMVDLPARILQEGVRAQARLVADGRLEFIASTRVVRGKPIGADPARLKPLRLVPGDTVAVLFDEDDADDFIIDWQRALLPLRRDSQATSGLAAAVAEHLTSALPQRAGNVTCALRTAERMGGTLAQVSLLDAYTRGAPTELTRWRGRFKDPAYQNRLLEVCPPAQRVPSGG